MNLCIDINIIGCYNNYIIICVFFTMNRAGNYGLIKIHFTEESGEMMKSILDNISKVILVILLSILMLLPYGCSSKQMGETTAEGNRRHRRNLRLNQQELMEDIDMVLLLDKPSKLTDKRIP